MKLISHLRLLATLRMSGAVPPSHIEILRGINLTSFERIKNPENNNVIILVPCLSVGYLKYQNLLKSLCCSLHKRNE